MSTPWNNAGARWEARLISVLLVQRERDITIGGGKKTNSCHHCGVAHSDMNFRVRQDVSLEKPHLK